MKLCFKRIASLFLALMMVFTTLVFTTSAVGKVTNLKVVETDNDEIDIKWSKVKNASKYRVYYKVDGKWKKAFDTKETEADIENLKSGKTYQVKVRAIQGKTLGSYSNTVTTSTEPAKVKNLKISATKNKKATLSWSKVTGATGYQVYKYASGKWSKLKTLTATKLSVAVAANGGTKFKVKAYRKLNNKNYYGDFSAVVTSKGKSTSTASVKKVTGVTVYDIDEDDFNVKWTKVSGATKYQVSYKKSSASTWKTVNVNNGKTSVEIEKLSKGTTYQVKVRAYKGGKWGSYSAVVTTSTEPDEVRNVTIKKTSSTKATLSWSKVTGATGYQVYKYVSGKWSNLKTLTATSLSVSVSSKGGDQFKVRAYRKINSKNYFGDFSDVVTYKVKASAGTQTKITAAKAKSIALADAKSRWGVNSNSIKGYKCELDREGTLYLYDISFHSGNYEYDYEINAATGKIIKSDREYDKDTVVNTGSNVKITEAKAKSIALADAKSTWGVNSNSIKGYKCELDKDDGLFVYEISFHSGNYEYDYEINAATGKIIKSDREYDKDTVVNTGSNSKITKEEAKSIALAHAKSKWGVNSNSINRYECELDKDDGLTVYEISFHSGIYEFDYEINAATGKIIKSDREIDD